MSDDDVPEFEYDEELSPEDCDIEEVPFELADVANDDKLAELSEEEVAELEDFTAYLYERGKRVTDEEAEALYAYFGVPNPRENAESSEDV